MERFGNTQVYHPLLQACSHVYTRETNMTQIKMKKYFFNVCLIWSTNIPLTKGSHISKSKIRPGGPDKVIKGRGDI